MYSKQQKEALSDFDANHIAKEVSHQQTKTDKDKILEHRKQGPLMKQIDKIASKDARFGRITTTVHEIEHVFQRFSGRRQSEYNAYKREVKSFKQSKRK